MSGWTKGDWVADRRKRQVLSSNLIVAHVCRGFWSDGANNEEIDGASAAANTALIAAAPELYEALSSGAEIISGELTGAEWKRACQAFLSQAEAALAKARGEPQ